MNRFFKAVSLVALAAGTVLSVASQAKAESVKFECQYNEQLNQYSTVMAGSEEALIVWTETLGSDHHLGAYTPGRRCLAVSTRLTNLAKSVGINDLSKLSDLGYVNGELVVFNSEYSTPIEDEVIFTLKPGNRYNAETVTDRFRFRVAPVGGVSLPDAALFPIVE